MLRGDTTTATTIATVVVYDDDREGLTGRYAILRWGLSALRQRGWEGTDPEIVATSDWAHARRTLREAEGTPILLADLVSERNLAGGSPGARLLRRIADDRDLRDRVWRVANSKHFTDTMLVQLRPWVHAFLHHPVKADDLDEAAENVADLLHHIEELGAAGATVGSLPRPSATAPLVHFPASGTRTLSAVTKEIVTEVARIRATSVKPLDSIYIYGLFRGEPYPRINERVRRAAEDPTPEKRRKVGKPDTQEWLRQGRGTTPDHVRALSHMATDGLGTYVTPQMIEDADATRASIVRAETVPALAGLTASEHALAIELISAYRHALPRNASADVKRDAVDDAVESEAVRAAHLAVHREVVRDEGAVPGEMDERFDLSHVLLCLAEAAADR